MKVHHFSLSVLLLVAACDPALAQSEPGWAVEMKGTGSLTQAPRVSQAPDRPQPQAPALPPEDRDCAPGVRTSWGMICKMVSFHSLLRIAQDQGRTGPGAAAPVFAATPVYENPEGKGRQALQPTVRPPEGAPPVAPEKEKEEKRPPRCKR